MNAARILIVDDEVAIRRQLAVGMAQRGFSIVESEDGLSALRQIEELSKAGEPVKIAVVDVVLPDINGLKLTSIIRSRYPEMKIVIISGHAGESSPEQVALMGADGFISKPFATEQLTDLIERLEVDLTPAAQPEVKPSAAYVLVSAQPSKAMAVYDGLAFQDSVVYCNAVRDSETDIVLLVHGRTHEVLEAHVSELMQQDGITGWEFLPVAAPELAPALQGYIDDYTREHAEDIVARRTKDCATAYVLVDIDPDCLESLYVSLYFLDGVVEIDASTRGDQLVLLLQGADFRHVNNALNQRIRHMDGVVRLHELKVVPFDEV